MTDGPPETASLAEPAAAPSPAARAVPAPSPAAAGSAGLTPLRRPAKTAQPLAPPARVRQAADAGGWGVLELGGDLQIDVSTEGDRSQIVSVTFDQRDRDGRPLIVITSICGPFEERHAAPLLRYNARLPYGAFTTERAADREEMVVLRAAHPAQSASTDDLRAFIAEIASRADKVESKLTGRDQF
jgi:hypothetical protein